MLNTFQGDTNTTCGCIDLYEFSLNLEIRKWFMPIQTILMLFYRLWRCSSPCYLLQWALCNSRLAKVFDWGTKTSPCWTSSSNPSSPGNSDRWVFCFYGILLGSSWTAGGEVVSEGNARSKVKHGVQCRAGEQEKLRANGKIDTSGKPPGWRGEGEVQQYSALQCSAVLCCALLCLSEH